MYEFAIYNDNLRDHVEVRLFDEECTIRRVIPHNLIHKAVDSKAFVSLEIQKIFTDWEARRYELDREWKDSIIEACFE